MKNPEEFANLFELQSKNVADPPRRHCLITPKPVCQIFVSQGGHFVAELGSYLRQLVDLGWSHRKAFVVPFLNEVNEVTTNGELNEFSLSSCPFLRQQSNGG